MIHVACDSTQVFAEAANSMMNQSFVSINPRQYTTMPAPVVQAAPQTTQPSYLTQSYIKPAAQQAPLEKVKLFENKKEREVIDTLGDLYGLIFAIDKLEKAYFKDDILPEEYTKECTQLLSKFKALKQAAEDALPAGGIDEFMTIYSLDCKAARKRIQIGVPATIEHGASVAVDQKQYNKLVAEAVRCLISNLR